MTTGSKDYPGILEC